MFAASAWRSTTWNILRSSAPAGTARATPCMTRSTTKPSRWRSSPGEASHGCSYQLLQGPTHPSPVK
eukprot:3367406-Prorocentrum_lima.AAC.1